MNTYAPNSKLPRGGSVMENSEFLFRRLEEEGYDLINQMIETKQEEHLFLDFKEKRRPQE